LFKYARSFHHERQRLKRAMVTLPQMLARTYMPSEIDHPDFHADWVKVPTIKPNPLYSNIADHPDETTASFKDVLSEIAAQKHDMSFLNMDASICDAAAVLQKQQFVGVVMGLRAELLHGAGLLHWVTLSTLVQALTSVKRSIRLKEGRHVVFKASCNVSIAPLMSADDADLPSYTVDILENGIPRAVLEHAFKNVHGILRPDFQPGRSGRTALWST
jgi:hypothetical protein